MPKIPGKPRCKHCGFRIRGPKHNDGDHHRNGVNGSYKPK